MIFLVSPGMCYAKNAGKTKQKEEALIAIAELKESSGICASRKNPGVFWSHNDSGSKPVLYAFDTQGRNLGHVRIAGPSRDWEDIACATVAGHHLIVVADVGDNNHVRTDERLLIIDEPAISKQPTAEAEKTPPLKPRIINFTWPEGKQNCEAVALCPDGQIILITKVYKVGLCTAFALHVSQADSKEKVVPKRIQDLKIPTVTAMDVSADGLRCVVLAGGKAIEYTRDPKKTWSEAFALEPKVIKVPLGKQTEAICYDLEAKALWLTSEVGRKGGDLTPLLKRELPPAP